MRFIVENEKFVNALAICQQALPREKAIINENLKNIYIKGEDDKLYLEATDLEVGVLTKIDAVIEEQGEACIPGKLSFDLISKISSLTLTVNINSNYRMEIDGATSSWSIQGVKPDDYPKFFAEDVKPQVFFDKETLTKIIDQVVVASSKNTLNPALSGVLIEVKDNKANFVAVDGNRLALRKIQTRNANISVVVPAKALQGFAKILGKTKKDIVGLTVDESRAYFTVGELGEKDSEPTIDLIFVARLIDAKFPNYEPVIPSNFTTKFSCLRGEIKEALERLEALLSASKDVVVIFEIDKNQVVLRTQNLEIGQGIEKITADRIETDDKLIIAFNVYYLLDALENIENPKIELAFTGDLSPAVIKPEKPDPREDYTYVVMPIRL